MKSTTHRRLDDAELDKLEFRLSEPGLRRLPASLPRVALLDDGSPLPAVYLARRSHRRFASGPVPLRMLSSLLRCLRQRRLADWPLAKYCYGSAGTLYPVQLYAYVKPGSVEAVSGGYYYHDPAAHSLVLLADGPGLEASRFGPNRYLADAAAFVLFLIARLAAIAPMYGDAAVRLSYLEAGLMTQLLELQAVEAGLGTCQLGGADYHGLHAPLRLDPDDLFLHAMIGGLPAAEQRP